MKILLLSCVLSITANSNSVDMLPEDECIAHHYYSDTRVKEVRADPYSYEQSRRLVETDFNKPFPPLPDEIKGNGYGKSYYAPQIITHTSSSWNAEYQRTYKELHNYFRPDNFFNEDGYYSKTYAHTYYDGYGYNFYNGNTGYYEYSRPPPKIEGGNWSVSSFLITLGGFVLLLGIYSWVYYYFETKEKSV